MMLPAHCPQRGNVVHRRTHGAPPNAISAPPPVLHSRNHPSAPGKLKSRVQTQTCQALPDPHSFSHLGEDLKVVIEAWPGLQNVSSASEVQPLIDALQSVAANAGSTGEYIAAMDPSAATTFADLSSNLFAGASPHMGTHAAMLASPLTSLTGILGGLPDDPSTSPSASAVLNAVASELTSLTSSLGKLLDGSAPSVDMSRLMAGMAASMSSGAGHGALIQNPLVATVSVASILVVAAVAEAQEAKRGLSEADADSREAAMALLQAERASQGREGKGKADMRPWPSCRQKGPGCSCGGKEGLSMADADSREAAMALLQAERALRVCALVTVGRGGKGDDKLLTMAFLPAEKALQKWVIRGTRILKDAKNGLKFANRKLRWLECAVKFVTAPQALLLNLLHHLLHWLQLLPRCCAAGHPRASNLQEMLSNAPGTTMARAVLLKEGCYCPERLAGYFANRPVLVAKRRAQVAAEAAGFSVALAMDFATDKFEANQQERAVQLRSLIERLGPAYVKVAQAVSTRVDLLPPAYFQQIQMLQDRVPPFPTSIARTVLEASLGKPVDAVFELLSDRPVAAASLGQVYYGVLRPEYGSQEVAVKVQRPGVLEAVALDLMLIRELAAVVQTQSRVDWTGIIDAWALRFFHEMDYSWEARAMNIFSQQMAPLKGIKVTQAVEELCSDEILTTDLPKLACWSLCSMRLTSELLKQRPMTTRTMSLLCHEADEQAPKAKALNNEDWLLLETGFLHADPHPGNLMRSDDGRLVILDFGLMTEVTLEQREALVSYIAHLINEDWPALAFDLQALGFIPKDVDPVAVGLVEPLGKVMKQLIGGGGAAKVNIDKVVDDLEQLGRKYPLEIPPFFALILRAFSVIEGIALGVDPDYAIVKECFPYLSRRLLNDDSPRTRELLREVLYGTQGRKRLDIERLTKFAEGLSAYNTDALTKRMSEANSSSGNGAALLPGGSSSPTDAASPFSRPNLVPQGGAMAPTQQRPIQTPPQPTIDPALREALLVVFSQEGSYIQELFIDELVAATDALSREATSSLVRTLLASFPLAATQMALNRLGPWRGVLAPLPTPVDVLHALAPVVAVTDEDREALQVVRGILGLAAKAMPFNSTASASNGGMAQGGGFGGSPVLASALSPPLSGLNGRSLFPTSPRALTGMVDEFSPLLAELLPGVAHTGELFVRALLSRAASRLSQSLALPRTDATSSMQQGPSYASSNASGGGGMGGRTGSGSSTSGYSRNGTGTTSSGTGTTTIDVESGPASTPPSSLKPELISNNGSNGQAVTLKPTSVLKEEKSSTKGMPPALPKGKYPAYTEPSWLPGDRELDTSEGPEGSKNSSVGTLVKRILRRRGAGAPK
ncbi:hypothetical protein DUNSADRAFT_12335 [Dunaliella salina]|uniref:Protein kinase domain-containing protein n=1 Tax=Dunaliella salina TaxID=3046 RepID=A0ABQ7GBK1_DUNSA|nr:hypothetical protein DUNSADRAFT_12335 [Dunaliella salina]|eukprot:KAF5831971.1 hypothetical protein DUNSADRAFT_12335 [Dunaliella salina]